MFSFHTSLLAYCVVIALTCVGISGDDDDDDDDAGDPTP